MSVATESDDDAARCAWIDDGVNASTELMEMRTANRTVGDNFMLHGVVGFCGSISSSVGEYDDTLTQPEVPRGLAVISIGHFINSTVNREPFQRIPILDCQSSMAKIQSNRPRHLL